MLQERFIIWDPRDGDRPRMSDDGTIESDGLIGRVSGDNAYIRTYAAYKPGTPRDLDGYPILDVGQYAEAVFSLSGSKGEYRVYRVA